MKHPKIHLAMENQNKNKQPGRSTPASNSEQSSSDEARYENGVSDRNSGNDDDFGSLTEGTEFANDDSNKNNNQEIEGIED